MKNSINKTKLATIIITVLLLTSAFLLIANVPVQAQDEPEDQPSGSQPLPAGVTPDLSVPTTAFLSFRPNPVGLNQIFLVNIWITPATHAIRHLSDYKVTITKPDGAQEVVTMDSYPSDATAWFEWIADQVGEWKLKFEFPGRLLPSGNLQDGESGREHNRTRATHLYSRRISLLPAQFYCRANTNRAGGHSVFLARV